MDLLKQQWKTSHPPWSIIIAVITGGAIVVLQHLLKIQKDPREPPCLYSRIPLVGHLIGLMRNGADYFHKLERRYHQPIYTLPILKGRMYIVSSPEWAQAVHKSHRSIQFNTLVAQAMKNLFLMDNATMDIINENLNDENGKRTGMYVCYSLIF